MLGAVTSLEPYITDFNSQVWLGITPAGASAELTPDSFWAQSAMP